MSTAKAVRKPIKVKKCITMLNCLLSSVSANRDSVKKMHDNIVEAMKEKYPEFIADELLEDVTPTTSEAPVVRVDQEVQVSMEELNKSTEKETPQNMAHNSQENELANGSRFSPKIVACVSQVENGCSSHNNHTTKGAEKSNHRKRDDSHLVIKVEDSGSDDSLHTEEAIARSDNVVNRMMGPVSAALNHSSPKAFLHYVVIENLPTRTTAEEVVNELFIGLIGINREDVTGITVHNEKTESIAQIYFKDLKFVQKILMFSGKLVFKGRVITSKIGMT